MIVVPYTQLLHETAEAVPEAEFVRMQDDDHYRRLLDGLWKNGEAFTLVEHDVVPTREQLYALDECPEPWCFYGYHPGHWVPVFGCVRFRAELLTETSDVWDAHPEWVWDQLDAKFAVHARAHGWSPHWHSPHVRHLGTTFNLDGTTVRREAEPEIQRWLLEREAADLDVRIPA